MKTRNEPQRSPRAARLRCFGVGMILLAGHQTLLASLGYLSTDWFVSAIGTALLGVGLIVAGRQR